MENFNLQVGRHIADFIEKMVPPLASELSGLAFIAGTGKGALFRNTFSSLSTEFSGMAPQCRQFTKGPSPLGLA